MNYKYKIELSGQRIGETFLEMADPPMGVVFGKILFDNVTSGYKLFKAHCNKVDVKLVDDFPEDNFLTTYHVPELKVTTDEGIEIKGVSTFVRGLDKEGFEISIVGIEYPFYEEQFPHHVKNYEERFK